MNYAVDWTVDALDQLAAIWTAATDRAAVTAASHRLDRELADDAKNTGESRSSPAKRTTFAKPLGIEFEVIEDDKKARVLRVWPIA